MIDPTAPLAWMAHMSDLVAAAAEYRETLLNTGVPPGRALEMTADWFDATLLREMATMNAMLALRNTSPPTDDIVAQG